MTDHSDLFGFPRGNTVRLLAHSEERWFMGLWKEHEYILGTDPASWRAFQAYKQEPDKHPIYCVEGKGFACFYKRQDGWTTLSSIAVSGFFRRQGVGKALLGAVDGPIALKTNADSAESNAFYQSLGFRLTGTARTNKGQGHLVNLYELEGR